MSKLYNIREFHNSNLTTPNKHNELYRDMLEELHNQYPELDSMGTYCLKFNGKIVYVGQSTYIAKRWVCHLFNAYHEESKEYNRAFYICFRHLAKAGNLEFEVLETTDIKEKLDWIEGFAINYYKPCLNKIVPKLWRGSKDIYLDEIPIVSRLALEELGKDIREHCSKIA